MRCDRVIERLLLLALAFVPLACSQVQTSISQQISAQYHAAASGVVDLGLVGSDEWDRVCVLPPYTTNRRAQEILGLPWDAQSKTSIFSSDAINVLVFMQAQKVVAHVEHPRIDGDFARSEPSCLHRSMARFKRVGNEVASAYLVPAL